MRRRCNLMIRDMKDKICSRKCVKERKDELINQRTDGPVNAYLIAWPIKAQNIQNLENIW